MQLASKLGYETVAYSRNKDHLELAKELGAAETVLTTSGKERQPNLDSAIVFAPAGGVVLEALKELKKGGSLSIAAIHMSKIPEIDYDKYLFGERKIMSVEANTRSDAKEFLDLAVRLKLRKHCGGSKFKGSKRGAPRPEEWKGHWRARIGLRVEPNLAHQKFIEAVWEVKTLSAEVSTT